jgi:hypothetical protein
MAVADALVASTPLTATSAARHVRLAAPGARPSEGIPTAEQPPGALRR